MSINENNIKELKDLYDRLERGKDRMMPFYADVVAFVRPTKGNVTDLYSRKVNTPDMSKLADDTALRYKKRLDAYIYSVLTNPDSVWMNIETDNNKLNKIQSSKQWFEDIEDIIMKELDNSNFYTESSKFYDDLTAFGISIMLVEKSKSTDSNLTFSTTDIFECNIAENDEGKVDILFRKHLMTARQVVQKFGIDNVSDKVKKSYEKEPEEYITIINGVFPRDVYLDKKKNRKKKEKPFASVWFEYDSDNILLNDGMDSFPYIVTRWDRDTGEIYGTSPIIDLLPSIRSAHLSKTGQIKHGQYQNDPVMIADIQYKNAFNGKFKPGAILFGEPRPDGRLDQIISPIITTSPQFSISLEQLKQDQENIKDGLYGNQITTPGMTKEMTAYEMRQRQLEATRILGPEITVLNTEWLLPLVLRIIDILSKITNPEDAKKTILPEPPQEILQAKTNYRIRFVSPLSKSQRLHEVESIINIINTACQWSQFAPQVLDNINFDFAFRRLHGSDLCPQGMLVPEDDRDKKRKEREDMEKEQRQIALAQAKASTMKDLGSSAKDFNGIDMGGQQQNVR